MLTLYDYLVQHGGFRYFLASAKIVGLDIHLRQEGVSTLFAPTDAAFAAIAPCTFDSLLAYPEQLAELLAFHCLPERLVLHDTEYIIHLIGLAGKRFTFFHGALHVNGARLIETDIECTNGIIHVIDKVLVPQMQRTYGHFKNEARRV
jgi:uncharacterized surface protein with fasciclin (FAS1) repeats